jgi:hypothetical protein
MPIRNSTCLFLLLGLAATCAASEVQITNAGSVINSEYHEAFSTISPDGLTLYVASDRPSEMGGGKPGDFYLFSNYNIYVSHRNSADAPWGELKMLGAPINTTSTDHSPYLSDDGHYLYFMSDRPGGYGEGDLYRSYRSDIGDDDGWGPAVNLGPGVNGPFVESCPTVLEQDGRLHLFYIQVSGSADALPNFMTSDWDPGIETFTQAGTVNISNPQGDAHLEPVEGLIWGIGWPGGFGGSDLWQSDHDPGDPDFATGWRKPGNLGGWINTAAEEIMPSPTRDGSIMIFGSDRPGGMGGIDIYFVTRN